MRFVFYLARRYFFSKKKQNVINIINIITVSIISITIASLFIVLSGFSGLREYGDILSNNFEIDYIIEPRTGKTLEIKDSLLKKIKQENPDILSLSKVVEEKVFLSAGDNSQIVVLRGVDSNYKHITGIDTLLILGNWIYKQNDILVGAPVKRKLKIRNQNSIQVLIPKRKKINSLLNSSPFTIKEANVSGVYSKNSTTNNKYAFANFRFVQELLDYEYSHVSKIIIKTNPISTNGEEFEKNLLSYFPNNTITIKDKFKLNEAYYKVLNTENIVVYFIFTLIIVISLFNLIGSLSMMILEKRTQLKILNAIGVSNSKKSAIFFLLGNIIVWVGGLIGLIIGIIIVVSQSLFPFVYIPNTGVAYPLLFELKNIFIVILTFLILGIIASILGNRKV